MKKLIYFTLLFAISFAMRGQVGAQEPGVIDLSDVVVIDDIGPNSEPPVSVAGSVVEIPEAEIEGASIDLEPPFIPEATEALPDETEIVLEIPGQEAQAPGEAKMASEETISVDFPDEDVRTILRNVADLFDLNLVIPDSLQGRTSVKLRNITWRQVFEVVLEPFGFTYIEDRNIIRIKSIEELTTEPVDTRVFIVSFADANELQGSILPLIDEAAGGQVRVDNRSNALVITERPSRMNKIQEIIERLDKPTAQVMIESKFIEVTNTDARNIGINWSSLSGYSLSAGPFQRRYDRTETDDLSRSNSFGNSSSVGSNTSEENTNVAFLQQQQILAGQVVGAGGPLLPVPSNQDERDEAFREGQPVPPAQYEGFGGTSLVTNDSSVTNASSITDAFSEVTSIIDTAVFSADQFEVILSALKSNDDIKLVSNPTVVTMDNKQAKIAIGDRFPLPSYSFNAETGQRQLDEIEYIDIGINLDVTPQVNSAGFINLQITPEVSSLNGTAIVESTQIPIIASRRAETNIMIKDGFTLAIGGLVQQDVSNSASRVPLLGDLPGVGRLFRSNTDSEQKRNLIIFITAQTLNPDGSTYRDVIDPRILNEMGIVPSDLPGYALSLEERELLRRLEDYRSQARNLERIGGTQSKIQAIDYAKEHEEAR
ncbi:MAG: type II secretion system protein GspD [Opitutales bacterium]